MNKRRASVSRILESIVGAESRENCRDSGICGNLVRQQTRAVAQAQGGRAWVSTTRARDCCATDQSRSNSLR